MGARWTLFCAMIDNFGDIGVCWRLARQLVAEHNIDVDLWVDDWASAGRFLQAQQTSACWQADAGEIRIDGVHVLRWHSPWPELDSLNQRVAESAMVIEAFGCELPEAVKLSMSQTRKPLLWLNLEYLSAEDWVPGCHALPSPHHYTSVFDASFLKKFFFFPGFVSGTGGLLRESRLLQQHADWQLTQQHSRRALLSRLGLQQIDASKMQLMISVFSYETPALQSWLEVLAQASDSTLCVIPEGRSLASLAGFSGDVTEQLTPGTVHRRGKLTLVVVPFMSQTSYDQLLSVCDFNLVRGEDSFVRAQWAAKPFMWHIYPQHDGVHMDKLDAFASAYLAGLDDPVREAWLRFARGWNLGEDCRDLWHYLRPQLPVLLLHTREWQKKLAVMPDLATNLVNFETFTKLSVRP